MLLADWLTSSSHFLLCNEPWLLKLLSRKYSLVMASV
jgi:hypothetical protein